MDSCKVKDVNLDSSARRLEIDLEIAGRVRHIYFHCADHQLYPNTEALVAMLLLPAMKLDLGCISIRGQVSAQFLRNLELAQDFYQKYKPEFRRVKIAGVQPIDEARTAGRRVATFFTGGVDSFYSLIQHQAEITDLVYVHGFDMPLDADRLRRQVSDMLRSVGDHFKVRVVEIETNAASVINSYVGGAANHGAMLASFAHLLAPQIGRIYIPSTRDIDQAYLYGSHPDLDPLWSTDRLTIIHDGADTTRVGKVALIAQHDIALRWLRVCTQQPYFSYNCGRCQKCIRTMINLHLAGALTRSQTFPTTIDPSKVARLQFGPPGFGSFARENLEVLEARGSDPEIARALRAALYDPAWKKFLRRVWYWLPETLSKLPRSLSRRLRRR